MVVFGFMTISPVTIAMILVLGVLFFGKNLPDVARQLGSSFKDLKKGLDEFNDLKRDVSRSVSLDGLDSSLSRDLDLEKAIQEETEKHSAVGTRFEPPV